MINQITGERLFVQIPGNYLFVADSQKLKIEALLEECGCSGQWSSNVSRVEPYSNHLDMDRTVEVWTVFLADQAAVHKLQSALDAQE